MTQHLSAVSRSSATPPPTLVVGGAGFIGSHVVEALLAAGGEVRVLDDLSGGRASNLPLHDPNLELRVGDMLDAPTVSAAMDGMARVVHLAAQRPRSGRDPYEAELANVLGFVNVLDAAQLRGIQRVVFASSAEVYGQGEDAPRDEEGPTAPVTAEGQARLVSEAYADFYCRESGVSALGLRYFNVYGPRQDRGVIAALVERIGHRRPALLFGDGQQTRDFIHVEDAARLTVAALDETHTGVCNAGSGERTSLRELTRLIGVAFDCHPLMHFAAARLDEIRYSQASTGRRQAWLPDPEPRGLLGGLADLVAGWEARERTAARTSRIRRGVFESHRLAPTRAFAGARRALSS